MAVRADSPSLVAVTEKRDADNKNGLAQRLAQH